MMINYCDLVTGYVTLISHRITLRTLGIDSFGFLLIFYFRIFYINPDSGLSKQTDYLTLR